jgi:hypothetical protein
MTSLPFAIVTTAISVFGLILFKDFFPNDLRLLQGSRRLVVSTAALLLGATGILSGSAVIVEEVEPTENQKVDWIE